MSVMPERIEIEIHTERRDSDGEKIDERTEPEGFESARECAEWLAVHGFWHPDEPGPYGRRTWLSTDATPDMLDESVAVVRSAHGELLHPRLWAAIVASASSAVTNYDGPYYVERRNDFGHLI